MINTSNVVYMVSDYLVLTNDEYNELDADAQVHNMLFV